MKSRSRTVLFWILSLSLLGMGLSACGLREKRDLDRLETQTKKQNELSDEREAQRAAEQRSAFESRKNLFEGLSGRYSGSYSVTRGTESVVFVEISTRYANQVAAGDPVREGSYQSAVEAMTLEITITESLQEGDWVDPQVLICEESGVKPTLETGLITVSCSPKGNYGLARAYTLFPDDLRRETSFTPQELSGKAREVTSRLLARGMNSAPFLGVEIFTAPQRKTSVQLTRIQ